MKNRCLYCYNQLQNLDFEDFHRSCVKTFFDTEAPPELEYSLDQMVDLAKNVVERSIAVPGVQPKLSLSLLEGSFKA